MLYTTVARVQYNNIVVLARVPKSNGKPTTTRPDGYDVLHTHPHADDTVR